MRRLPALITLVALVALVAATGCTDRQVAEWVKWFTVEPDAAVAFAEQPEVQASLATRGEADEPEPARSVWDDLAWCESGGRWDYNGSSGYDGGLQFLPSVWTAYDGPTTYAWQASRAQQIAVAERILDDVGWQAWPTCSRKLGLR